jgi:hypothetical protein
MLQFSSTSAKPGGCTSLLYSFIVIFFALWLKRAFEAFVRQLCHLDMSNYCDLTVLSPFSFVGAGGS